MEELHKLYMVRQERLHVDLTVPQLMINMRKVTAAFHHTGYKIDVPKSRETLLQEHLEKELEKLVRNRKGKKIS